MIAGNLGVGVGIDALWRLNAVASIDYAVTWPFADTGLTGTPWADVTRTGLARRIGPTGLDEWGPHNLLARSWRLSSWTASNWTATPPTFGGQSVVLNGAQTGRFTATDSGSGYYLNNAFTGAAGQQYTITARVARVSGNMNINLGTNTAPSRQVEINPATGAISGSGAAYATVTAVAGGWKVDISYAPDASGGVTLLAFPQTGSTATTYDIAYQVTAGGAQAALDTDGTARYLPRIAYSPSLDVNGQPYAITESYGAELVTDPSFDSPGAWTATGASVSGGQASFSDTTTNTQNVLQSLSLTGGRTYRVTLTGTGTVNARTNTDDTASTYALPATFFVSKSAYTNGRLQVYNVSGSAAVVTSVSVKEFLGVVPSAQPMCLGLQVEGAATNLAGNTDALSSWLTGGGSVSQTPNTHVGPDGRPTADTLVLNSGSYVYYGIGTLSSVQRVHSMFIRRGTGTVRVGLVTGGFVDAVEAQIDTSTGTVGAAVTAGSVSSASVGAIPHGTDWWRVYATATMPATGLYLALRNMSVPPVTVVAVGSQCETGSYPTSYIPNPTTGTAIRARDACVLTGDDLAAAFPAGFLRGTVVVRFRGAGAYVNDHAVFALSNDVGNSTSTLLASMSGTTVYVFAWNTATSAAGLILDGSTVNRLAVSWDCVAGKVSVALNGGSATERTTGVDFTGTGIAAFGLGTARSGSALYDNQGISVDSCDTSRSGQYLTGAALQALTA